MTKQETDKTLDEQSIENSKFSFFTQPKRGPGQT